MRQNYGFSLQRIAGVPYLLPYGQAAAEHKRGLRLNETSAFIWEAMDTCFTREELLNALCNKYDIEFCKKDKVLRDLDEILHSLGAFGMISEDDVFSPLYKRVNIGGISLALCGDHKFFHEAFDVFSEENSSGALADIKIEIFSSKSPDITKGVLILENENLHIYDCAGEYLLLFPKAVSIDSARLKKDGASAAFYLKNSAYDTLKEELFHAIRFVFLYKAGLMGFYALHSASILYEGKVWLLSGPSGRGKSTQAALWSRHCGVTILNGDLNLLSLSAKGSLVHGLPWCGTSGISAKGVWPLGGIILLGQSDTDIIEELSDDAKALLVSQRLISTGWTKEQLFQCLTFSEELTSQVKVCRFNCTKNPSAVDVLRRWIDD